MYLVLNLYVSMIKWAKIYNKKVYAGELVPYFSFKKSFSFENGVMVSVF